MSTIQRVLFVSDWHLPHIDERSLDAFLTACMKLPEFQGVDRFIFGGDMLDFATLSPKYIPLKTKQGEKVREELEDARRLFKEVLNVVKPKQVDWLDGNHDERVDRLLKAKLPAMHGLFDLHKDVLKLKELGIQSVIPYENGNGYLHVGRQHTGLYCVHGWIGAKRTPGETARSHALAIGGSVLHGHSHVCEDTAVVFKDKTIYAAACGGLFDVAELKKQYAVWPTWRHGCGYAEITDGTVTYVCAASIEGVGKSRRLVFRRPVRIYATH